MNERIERISVPYDPISADEQIAMMYLRSHPCRRSEFCIFPNQHGGDCELIMPKPKSGFFSALALLAGIAFVAWLFWMEASK